MPTWMKVVGLAVAAALLVMALLLFVGSARRRGRSQAGARASKTRDRFVRSRMRRGGRS